MLESRVMLMTSFELGSLRMESCELTASLLTSLREQLLKYLLALIKLYFEFVDLYPFVPIQFVAVSRTSQFPS
jgi:hypothetical protein